MQSTRKSMAQIFSITRQGRITPDQLDELEEKMLLADMGLETATGIIESIERSRGKNSWDTVRLRLSECLQSGEMNWERLQYPLVLIITGVNGTGKTTTAAKLARWFHQAGKSVLLVAADTYRAAAIRQLEIWSERLNIRLISNARTQDPSSVVFDGLESAKKSETEVVIVDTAGRLHTSRNLMGELGKIVRVIKTHFPRMNVKTLLTLDANLGQNSNSQVRQFQEYLDLNGIILTKMDGSAKGGVIFSIIKNHQLPVWFIGTGEQLEDLEPFTANEFLTGLLGEELSSHA